MQIVAICQEFGWTYQEYMSQPSWFLTLIREKMVRDNKEQERAAFERYQEPGPYVRDPATERQIRYWKASAWALATCTAPRLQPDSAATDRNVTADIPSRATIRSPASASSLWRGVRSTASL